MKIVMFFTSVQTEYCYEDVNPIIPIGHRVLTMSGATCVEVSIIITSVVPSSDEQLITEFTKR